MDITNQMKNVFISGTFVIEPIAEVIKFWSQFFIPKATIHITEYNQLYKNILDNKQVEGESLHLYFIRFDDWLPDNVYNSDRALEDNLNLFISLLSKRNTTDNYIVMVCPCTLNKVSKTTETQLLDHLYNAFKGSNTTLVLNGGRAANKYLSKNSLTIKNSLTEKLGHLPYSKSFSIALGTYLCEQLFSWQFNTYKVIAVDCDNTLWHGVAAEIGHKHVSLTSSHLYLQKRLLAMKDAGMLLCLISKNQLNDIKKVFQNADGMPLKFSDFVDVRINWNSKSSNIISLSETLNISLNDFIFIDDNPIEVAEVKSHCPQTLTVHLPPDISAWKSFINLSWLFTKIKKTSIDSNRSQYYLQEQKRKQEQTSINDYQTFIDNLNLTVTITPLTDRDYPRAIQLTERTNQFNCFKKFLSEEALVNLVNDSDSHVEIIHASDRFGDYGQIGLIIYQYDSQALIVKLFLLSCRILSRGVEHEVARHLAREAKKKKVPFLKFNYKHTDKNEPAKRFLISIKPIHVRDRKQYQQYEYKSQDIRNIAFCANSVLTTTHIKHDTANKHARLTEGNLLQKRIDYISNISDYESLEKVYYQMCKSLPHNTSKKSQLITLVEQVFGHSVNSTDSFSTLNGSSLQAIELLGLIYDHYQVSLTIPDLINEPNFYALTCLINTASKDLRLAHSLQSNNSSTNRALISNQQESLWHLANSEYGTALNIVTSFELHGDLDVNALSNSFEILIQNHDSLRASFHLDGNNICYSVNPTSLFKLEVDLLAKKSQDIDAHLSSWLEKLYNYEFSLDKSPLFKAILVCGVNKHYYLIIALHHIIADEWSLNIFFKELSNHYNHLQKGVLKKIASARPSYIDYIQAQKEQYNNTLQLQEENFWCEKLAASKQSSLPRKPKKTTSSKSNVHCLTLSNDLATKIDTLSHHHSHTFFVALYTCFTMALYHYTNDTTQTIAIPFANRDHYYYQQTLGLFAQLWPVTTVLDIDNTFLDQLSSIAEEIALLSKHTSVSFTNAARQQHMSKSCSPCIETAFVLYDRRKSNLNLNNIISTEIPNISPYQPADLLLQIERHQDQTTCSFIYNNDVFESFTITQLASVFNQVTQLFLTKPNSQIKFNRPLSPITENYLLKLSAPFKDRMSNDSILNIFSEHVLNAPEKPAIITQKTMFSYHELDKLANRCVSSLISLRPQIIALILDNSIELVIAILAVLKSNASYLPLDPKIPMHRLKILLADSKVDLVLVNNNNKHLVTDLQTHVMLVEKLLNTKYDTALCTTRTNKLSYIMYTSGTTGQPKPVAIEERGIIALAKQLHFFEITPHDVVAQFSNVAFDAYTFELFGALLNGASLLIIPNDFKLNLIKFKNFLQKHKVTILLLPSSYYHHCIDLEPTMFSSVKHLLVGGEQINSKAAEKLLTLKNNKTKLYHAYGPTEATCIASLYPITLPVRNPIPIGYPVCGKALIVVNSQLKLAPPGAWGELAISGEGVSPQLSPNNTVSNITVGCSTPFSNQSILRTGDRVRWLENGGLEFGGRLDRQAKVRGFRLSLTEIECIMETHSSIKKVIIDLNNYSQLIAYIYPKTSKNNHKDTSELLEEVRRFSEKLLPNYMQPHKYKLLSYLPITSHGKIDVCSLEKYTIPTNNLKLTPNINSALFNKIQSIWKTILNLPSSQPEDNFFELGGDSLKLTILLTQLQQQYHIAIPIKQYMQTPTLLQLYTIIKDSQIRLSPLKSCITLIQKTTSADVIIMIHPLTGLATHYYGIEKYFPQSTIYSIQSPSLYDDNRQFNSLEMLAKYYAYEIVSNIKADHYHLVGWSFGGLVALEIARIINSNQTYKALPILVDSYHPDNIDLSLFESKPLTPIEKYHFQLITTYKPAPYDKALTLLAIKHHSSSFDNNLKWDLTSFPELTIQPIEGTHNALFLAPLSLSLIKALKKSILKNNLFAT